VRELIRRGAEVALHPPAEWLDELDAATLAGRGRQQIADDPVLAASTRRTNLSNLQSWAAANVRAPGERVPANLGEATLAIARDLVRRGLDEASLDAYRAGQAVAVRLWTGICLSLTSDQDELREMLDITFRSIAAFLDDTLDAIADQIARERRDLTTGSQAERRETVTLVLEGAPIARARAEKRLGYRLGGEHTAAVVWCDDADAGLSAVDDAARAVAGSAGASLIVLATAATRWVWIHGRPDLGQLRAAAAATPAVRIAIGTTGRDLDGFRRSHLDALTTQRVIARLGPAEQVVAFNDIELVTLLTADDERVESFLNRTLGQLQHAPADITGTVRAYIAAECNATGAAARMYTHRNTLLRRLARADQLLPRPLAANVVNVAVALEISRWRQSSHPAAGLRPPPASHKD
jgi:DNA-binding PucR family transcriptional regulator